MRNDSSLTAELVDHVARINCLSNYTESMVRVAYATCVIFP